MEYLGTLASCDVLQSDGITLHADATLYARHDLAETLRTSTSKSDSELILAAYRRWGRDCAAHLNGDFRFIIEDRQRERVLAAVDHIATRPLFYADTARGLIFSSSVRALVDNFGGVPELDEQRVANLLVSWMSWSASGTLCQNIRKVPFAHTIEWRRGDKSVRRYWHPAQVKPLELVDEAAYVERGREVFSAAVRDRALADTSVAAHVSGGLDSSAIAVLSTATRRNAGMSDLLGIAWQPWAPDNPPDSEGGWIAAVQAVSGIDIRSAIPTSQSMLELLKLDLVGDYNVGNLLNEDAVQEIAQQRGIGLILSGLGGDEALTFNGKFMARHLVQRGRINALSRLHRSGGLRGFAAGLVMAAREGRGDKASAPPDAKIAKSFASEALLSHVEIEPHWQIAARAPRAHQIERLSEGYISERIEVLAQSGERKGIRYSFPMLDRRVLEFALSVPVELFWRQGTRRWLFREMMKGVLPENVRMNQVKREPVRIGVVLETLHEALRVAGEAIGSRDKFQRSDLLQMDRLRAQLRDPESAPGIAPLRLAVQLLDW